MLDMTQTSVKKELDKLERKYGKKFSEYCKTLTVDNGSEFLKSIELETSTLDYQKKDLNYITLILTAHGSEDQTKTLIS